jgi:hypothetical protein
MKNSLRFAVPLLLLSLAPGALAATDAEKSFDQLKSLVGAWEGKTSQGQPVTVTFRNTAGGSAVMSEIEGAGSHDMITMFHMDGPNRLLMTHYCGAGNQPRMQASASPDAKTLTFNFVDGTNLEGGQPGHMQQLVLSMPDANHHVEEWNFQAPGSTMKEVFDLRRKN